MTGPPGPKGYPLVGSIDRFARDPFGFLEAVGRAYGRVARFSLGPESFVMLADPADVEAVLVGTEATYEKARFGSDATGALLGEGLLLSGGDVWRERRRLMQPAFAGERMPGYAEVMGEHVAEAIEAWEVGDRIDVHFEMARLTVKIIVDAMFGVTLPDETVRTLQEALVPIGRRFEPDPLRAVLPNWLPTAEGRAFDEALETLDGVVSGIAATAGRDPGDDGSLMSILQGARSDGRLSRADLRDELVTMLLAGHDTTALALTYTFSLLSRHPAVEERLAAEVDEVLSGPLPTEEDLADLEYAERVVTEAMRLYPPVYAIFRQPTADVTIGGYDVPAGTTLMLPQWVVHRSPDHYEDPERFDPDRWAPERAEGRHPYAYFPFGGGPRACIGRQFSMVEATLILAAVTRRYRLSGPDEPPELRASITMHPREPIEMTVEPR